MARTWKQGVVSAVKNGKVIVDVYNMYKKHVKGDGKEKKSAIIDIAKPMDVSKVMLVCPNCSKPTRVGIKRENGKVERVCKKCGKVIEVAARRRGKRRKERS
jgi:large subunit ribosomal protein L24